MDIGTNKTYFAFISYKREDKNEAKRLQHYLEYYRLPNHLREANPELPVYVRPVFRDVTDLEVGELSAQIQSALKQSNFLIVVCSPRAAHSKWVNDEIDYFISLGKQDMIIPYIIEGVPYSKNPHEECFPPALLKLSGEKELLGANINEVGRDSATIRIVSRMFNLRFDSLFQRYQREQRKRRIRRSFAILFSFLLVMTITGWIWIQNNRLKESIQSMMIAQSRAVAEKANQVFEAGDSYTARKLAIAVLPHDVNHPTRPFVPEVETVLRKALDNNNCILYGHSGPVRSISFSPQDDLLVSGGNDASVRLWDIATGKQIRVLQGHSQKVNIVSFDSKGDFILSSSDNKICIWSTSNNIEWPIGQIGSRDIITSAQFCPNKESILFTTSNHVVLWDYFNGSEAEILSFPQTEITSAIVSPDGSIVVALDKNGVLYSLDIQSNKVLHKISGHSFPILFDSQLIHGDSLVAYGGKNGEIIIWNYRTGEYKKWLGHKSEVSSVGVNMTGDKLVSLGRDGVISIWDTNSKTIVSEFECDPSDLIIEFIDNTALNTLLLLGINTDGAFYIKIIDTLTGTIIDKTNLPHSSLLGVHGCSSINHSGNVLAFSTLSGDIKIKQIISEGFEIKQKAGMEVNSSTHDINGNHILIGEKGSVLELAIDEQINKIIHYLGVDSIKVLRLHPKGDRFIVATDSYLYGFDNGERKHITPLKKSISDIVYTPDGESIIAICDSSIVFFDSATMDEYAIFDVVKEGYHIRSPLHLLASNGYFVTWNLLEPSIRVWDSSRGFQKDVINQMYPFCISISDDGNNIAIGDVKGDVYVYNFATEEKTLLKNGHSKLVMSVRFSPDETKLVSCGIDNSVIVWNVKASQIINKYTIKDAIDASFSNDGKQLIVINTLGDIFTKEFLSTQELIKHTENKFADNPLTKEELEQFFLE